MEERRQKCRLCTYNGLPPRCLLYTSTMLANGVFGESVITALTAQNTMGVDAVMNVPADFIEAQMKAVFTDIFPDAVKIGMTSSVDTIEAIAAGLVKYKAKNIPQYGRRSLADR